MLNLLTVTSVHTVPKIYNPTPDLYFVIWHIVGAGKGEQ